MPIKWREWIRKALSGLFGLAVTVLLAGAVQVLLSLVVWPIVFRRHPLGFSMALSLVGFGSWGLAFIMSFSARRRAFGMGRGMPGMAHGMPGMARGMPSTAPSAPEDLLPIGREGTLMGRVQDQVRRTGCGCLLLLSSLIPLMIAFGLRLQADLRAGLTLRDILPPPP